MKRRTENSRLLAAKIAYYEIRGIIDGTDATSSSFLSPVITSAEIDKAEARILQHRPMIDEMLQRAEEAENTISSWGMHDVGDDSEWILGSQLLGIQTHYKVGNDGLLTVRMESASENLPIFEQLAVIHEVDFFRDWVPFCSKSSMVAKMSHTELAAYFKISAPFMSRDTTLRAYGVDALNEHNLILLSGKSVEEIEGEKLPFEERSWFHDRLEILEFKTLIEVTEPTKAKMTIIAKVNLNCPLPTPIVNFVVRHLAGMILLQLQNQTKKIVADPFCKFGQRIRDDKVFYTDWLLKKLEKFCEFKNWDVPEIACLNVDQSTAQNHGAKFDGSNNSESDPCISLPCFAVSLQFPSLFSCFGLNSICVEGHDHNDMSAAAAETNNIDGGDNILVEQLVPKASHIITSSSGAADDTVINQRSLLLCILLDDEGKASRATLLLLISLQLCIFVYMLMNLEYLAGVPVIRS